MDLSRAGSYTFKTCHFRFTLYSGRLHHRVTCQKVTQIAIDQISYLKWDLVWLLYEMPQVSMEHVNPFQLPWEEMPSGAEPIKKAKGMLSAEVEFLCTVCKFNIKVVTKRHHYTDRHCLCQTASLSWHSPRRLTTPCSCCCTWGLGQRHRARHSGQQALRLSPLSWAPQGADSHLGAWVGCSYCVLFPSVSFQELTRSDPWGEAWAAAGGEAAHHRPPRAGGAASGPLGPYEVGSFFALEMLLEMFIALSSCTSIRLHPVLLTFDNQHTLSCKVSEAQWKAASVLTTLLPRLPWREPAMWARRVHAVGAALVVSKPQETPAPTLPSQGLPPWLPWAVVWASVVTGLLPGHRDVFTSHSVCTRDP